MRTRKLYYDIVRSENLGDILVMSTDTGLFRIEFPISSNHPRELFQQSDREAEVVRGEARLKDVTRQLKEFLKGKRRDFEVKFDFEGQTPFSRKVLLKTFQIPYGKTVTYGALARSCGRPGGARAVGQVMAKNPLPIIIPCHRVLASDGKLGGYSGGLKYKRILLDLEGIKT